MLVITRRAGESLILQTSDGEIEIIIGREVKDGTKVFIDAPKSVAIVRKELIDREE